ncbi:hypothetical protein PVK06_000612 [Gossypium arboreum]|uniref:Uncharacterized protein n=1 Tax=Gossypium arboreum TaxID=29729 RepID=A0ABR0R001_GOSAR|nr:hypothetical protein PVK06_000612 [Gossypium arboreum]
MNVVIERERIGTSPNYGKNSKGRNNLSGRKVALFAASAVEKDRRRLDPPDLLLMAAIAPEIEKISGFCIF